MTLRDYPLLSWAVAEAWAMAHPASGEHKEPAMTVTLYDVVERILASWGTPHASERAGDLLAATVEVRIASEQDVIRDELTTALAKAWSTIRAHRFDHEEGKVGGPDSFYNGMLHAATMVMSIATESGICESAIHEYYTRTVPL